MGRTRDDVGLAGPASFHREDVTARRVLDVGPAIRGPFRNRSKLALEVTHERGPNFARVAGTIVDARLHDDEREPGADHRFRDLVVGTPPRPAILRHPRAIVPLRR